MNKSVFQKIASAVLVSWGAIATTLPAHAGNLINGWDYARDDYSYDGSDANGFSPTSRFDIYGIGVKQVNNEVWVGINASTPLTGASYSSAADGNIGWGDLFLDFGVGSTFSSAQGSMLGIRFAATNDSIAPTTGVYTNVTGKSVALDNSGYTNLNHYANHAPNAVIGDLALNDPYYAAYANAGVPNVINKFSSRIGDVQTLSSLELATLPVISAPNGSTHLNTFGFKFNLPSTYTGSFIGSLFLECINDAVAIKGNVRPVPVPPAIAGILAAGAFGGWRATRRKKQLTAKAVAA